MGPPKLINAYAISRYAKFYKSLKNSVSQEVKFLVNIVSRDIHSVTGKNLQNIRSVSGFNPNSVSSSVVRHNFARAAIPPQDMWRIPVLNGWLKLRREMEVNLQDTDYLCLLIDALCSS